MQRMIDWHYIEANAKTKRRRLNSDKHPYCSRLVARRASQRQRVIISISSRSVWRAMRRGRCIGGRDDAILVRLRLRLARITKGQGTNPCGPCGRVRNGPAAAAACAVQARRGERERCVAGWLLAAARTEQQTCSWCRVR
jgi:hypothetical protein